MLKPSISLIVTSFNVAEFIEQAISSVIKQTIADNIEIILVDDGSTDDSVAKARPLLAGFKRVQIIEQENAGAGGARNVGIRLAQGDYICFLDGDDWLFSESVLAALHQAAMANQADVVCSNRVQFKDKNQRIIDDVHFENELAAPAHKIPKLLGRVAIHGKLFCRDFLIRHGIYFPEKMSVEDFVFSYRLLSHSPQVAVITAVSYVWRQRAGSNTSLTQARLTPFSLQSRFQQIEMTQAIIANSQLSQLYPHVKFARLDYQTRIIRHLKRLPAARDPQVQQVAFDLTRAFINKHQTAIFNAVDKKTAALYQLFLAGSLTDVLGYLQRNYIAAASPAKTILSNQQLIQQLNQETYQRVWQRVQANKVIQVGFLVSDNTKWNATQLLNKLQANPLFNCTLYLTLTGRDKTAAERKLSYAKEQQFFRAQAAPLVELYDPETDKRHGAEAIDADVIFYQQPWGMAKLLAALGNRSLAVYMPYGYLMYQNYQMEYKKPEFHPYLWRYFSQSEAHKQIQLEQVPASASQIVVSGYPKLDVYAASATVQAVSWHGEPKAKRIIYAPHHSLAKEPMRLSTFAWNHGAFLTLALQYPTLTSWVYRPHARLKYVVEKNGVMTQAEYQNYQAKWQTLANARVVAEGEYFDLFKTSDVLITDCSSFLGEYLPTEKPVIWLVSDKPGFQLNPVGKKITDSYYQVRTRQQLLEVFQRVVIQGDDYLKPQRLAVLAEVFATGFNAAERIETELQQRFFSNAAPPAPAIPSQERLDISKNEISGIVYQPVSDSPNRVALHIYDQQVSCFPMQQLSPAEQGLAWHCFNIPLSRKVMRYIADKKALAVSIAGKPLAVTTNKLPIWREVNRLPLAHLSQLLSRGWYFDQAMALVSPYPSALAHGFAVKLINRSKPYCTIRLTQSLQAAAQAGEVKLFVDDLALGVALFARSATAKISFSFNLNKKLLAEIFKRHSMQFEINQVRYELPLSVFSPLQAEINAIVITKPQLLSRLNNGYLLNQTGRLIQPKDLDSQWLADTLALYHKACECFTRHFNYTLYLTGGTLLGYARAGGVISFDKDFDSGYLSAYTDVTQIKAEFKAIIITLLHAGEDIRLLTPIGDKIRCDYFMWYDKTGAHIDVFPGAFIAGKYRRPTFVDTQLGRDDFLPFKVAGFNGYQVNVPNNVEKKVAAVYGANWRYPDPFWKKVRGPDIVKYRQEIMLNAQDCLDIAAVSVSEGEKIRQLISTGKFASQL